MPNVVFWVVTACNIVCVNRVLEECFAFMSGKMGTVFSSRMRLRVLTALKMLILIFWVASLYGHTTWCLPTSSHSVTTQKKIEVICSFKTMVTTYKTAQCHNPADHSWHFHHCKNFRSQTLQASVTLETFILKLDLDLIFMCLKEAS
jgi:hypothetical protein